MNETKAKDTFSRKEIDLFAKIVSANVEVASKITNRLLDLKEEEIQNWAKQFLMLYISLTKIPWETRTNYIQILIDDGEYLAEQARKIIKPDPN